MLSQTQAAQFQQDGFLNMGQVLSQTQVQSLSDALDQVIDKGPDGFGADEPQPIRYANIAQDQEHPVWQIVNMWEASALYESLIYHPLVVEAISQLTGFKDLLIWHDQVQYKPAGYGGATCWHQDAPLWPAIEPMTPVSAWIPLDDATVENGCMWMVPGSHRWGNNQKYLDSQSHLDHLEGFDQVGVGFDPPADALIREIRPRPCPVRRGEIHLHHSLTWHGSPFNESDHPRRAIAIHYMSGQATYTGRNHLMAQWIKVPAGGCMADAGDHFPVVCKEGQPVRPQFSFV